MVQTTTISSLQLGIERESKNVLLSETCSELLSTQLCCSRSEGGEISIHPLVCFCTTSLRTTNHVAPVTSSSMGPRPKQPLTLQGRSPLTFLSCTCMQSSLHFRPCIIFPGCNQDSTPPAISATQLRHLGKGSSVPELLLHYVVEETLFWSSLLRLAHPLKVSLSARAELV